MEASPEKLLASFPSTVSRSIHILFIYLGPVLSIYSGMAEANRFPAVRNRLRVVVKKHVKY